MQGFNMGRYHPPETLDTSISSSSGSKPQAHARPKGPPTVRFEMPFPIWCSSCPNPTIIGQGVRFNSEKKKIGNYFSTPIWSFRMKHADCSGYIELQTDPKRTAYVVVSGAKKREMGEEEEYSGKRDLQAGEHAVLTDKERGELRGNAFANLEKTIADRERLVQSTQRIDELVRASAKHWEDPYTKNSKLRKTFREVRKRAERDEAIADDVKNRMGLGIDLLPAIEEDARRASLVDFGPDGVDGAGQALKKPLFGANRCSSKRAKSARPVLKSEVLAQKRREGFASEIMSNSRTAKDPFLIAEKPFDFAKASPAQTLGNKRKRIGDGSHKSSKMDGTPTRGTGLVDYESE